MLLSPTEWADVFLDQGGQIRRGERRNGFWHILVEQAAEYEFTLRRWSPDVDLPMRAATPAHQGECGQYPAGVALPIAKAGLRIGERTESLAVGPEDREKVFRLQLPMGRTRLQTWFYDEAGAEISGAYYVYAKRMNTHG